MFAPLLQLHVEKKRAAGADSDDSFSRSCFPQPDAMARSAPNVFLRTVREFGLGADQAIACPCRVTETTRTGQGITSFVRETNGHCHQRVAPRSNRIGSCQPSGGPAPRISRDDCYYSVSEGRFPQAFCRTRACVARAQVQTLWPLAHQSQRVTCNDR